LLGISFFQEGEEDFGLGTHKWLLVMGYGLLKPAIYDCPIHRIIASSHHPHHRNITPRVSVFSTTFRSVFRIGDAETIRPVVGRDAHGGREPRCMTEVTASERYW